MKVIRAKSAGFCFGVERAIGIARRFSDKDQKIYTDGPLIHNRQMMEVLHDENIHELDTDEQIEVLSKTCEACTLVLRAHGISPMRRDYLKSLGIKFKDATCPDVGKIAGRIKVHAIKGYTVIIFGDPKHPEIIGLKGYTKDGKGYVVKTFADVDALPEIEGDICVVSQSTMFTKDYREISDYIKERFPEAVVIDTICGATKERQKDVTSLAEEGAQAIVVIGGKHSANTIKLAIMAEKTGLPCYHVETVAELDLDMIKANYEVIGVTAGASTPRFLIDELCEKIEKL